MNGRVLGSFLAGSGDRGLRDLDDVLEVDAWARVAAEEGVSALAGAHSGSPPGGLPRTRSAL